MSRTWWAGALLGGLFLGCSLAAGWNNAPLEVAPGQFVASWAGGQELGTAFWRRSGQFLVALLFLHAAYGIAIWLYTRLLCRGFPMFDRHPALTLWACWLLFAVFVIWGNIAWYPASSFATRESIFAAPIGGLVPAAWIALGLAAIAAASAIAALRRRYIPVAPVRRFPPRAYAATAVVAITVAIGWLTQLPAANSQATGTGQPNVIVIGLDSLRDDLPGADPSSSLTPNVDAFLKGGTRFADTTTPLARTFGSWIAILTGKHPVSTHARVNLMPRRLVREGETLPDRLQAQGYSTIYATDEVRFANIDESYGFDRVVTPPVGATDFLLGRINDLPLSNLVSPTWVARWLFPNSWANRAVNHTYRPSQFTARLHREFAVTAPAFAAIHLTLAHWPYNRAGQPLTRARPLEMREAYRSAVREMDRQFGDVMTLLEHRGLLRNALVVLLSDHGEAMGRPEDSMLRDVLRIEERWGSMWGHGTSVMSPHQYQVLLAFRGYGPSVLPAAGSSLAVPASLEDVAPTVMEFLGPPPRPGEFDGRSLMPLLRDEPGAGGVLADRIRFTETDFNTASVLRGSYDVNAVLAEGGQFYEVDPASGWVQFKADRLGDLFAQKERAAFSGQQLLAALPSREGGQRYYLTDRREHHPRLLESRPDPRESPQEARLWDALQGRFRGELLPVPDPPRL